jgi:hypothetical protein
MAVQEYDRELINPPLFTEAFGLVRIAKGNRGVNMRGGRNEDSRCVNPQQTHEALRVRSKWTGSRGRTSRETRRKGFRPCFA